jgi:TATA-binding related factor (TRF) of subunit 20 of Mediator complex
MLDSIYLIPATQPSPIILAHITLTFPCTALPQFNLAHHLFASTSSLLLDSNPWPPTLYSRPFLSVLTLSTPSPTTAKSPGTHPPSTFITTSYPNPIPSPIESPGAPPVFKSPDTKQDKLAEAEKRALAQFEKDRSEHEKKVARATAAALAALKYETTSITIPTAEAASFMEMLAGKMAPLWALRGTERVENGTSISLCDGEWTLRIGDLRQSTTKAGVSSSTLRGVLCEVTWTENEGKVGDVVGKDEKEMITAFLARLLEGTGANLDAARRLSAYTPSTSDTGTNWALAELYTELLRSRG